MSHAISRARRGASRRIRSLTAPATGILTVTLVAVAAVHIVRPERWAWSVCLTAVSGWMLVAAYPLLLLAVRTGRRALVLAAVVLCLTQLVWMVRSTALTGGPMPAAGATLRIASANLLMSNPHLPDLMARIRADDPDVVCVQELSPAHLATIEAGGLLAGHPYRITDPLPGVHGSAIWSRLPVTAAAVIGVGGYPMTRMDVRTAAGPVRIVNVHTAAPLDAVNLRIWRSQLAELPALVPADHPVVLVGDFNATADHRSLAALQRHGLRDAFTEAGRGLGTTWPRWSGPVFPLLRLDHALVSEPLTVVSVRTADSPGSDHRRLVVELAVPGAE